MKKLTFTILLFLFFIRPTLAQGPIFLPVISTGKGNDCMTEYAILEVGDGTTTVNLLQGKRAGFHLKEWTPAIIAPKGGGIFQDSPQAAGRRLVYAVDATAIESFDLVVNNFDQNAIIRQAQDLLRLLLKGRNYDATNWQDTPVWVKAQAACEDNARYALIINFTIPNLDNPYAQPFYTANQVAAMDDITLVVERDHWQSTQPGTGSCVQISSEQDWPFGTSTTTRENTLTEGSSIITVANGDMFAGDDGQIWRSIDNGTTWAVNTTLPAGLVLTMRQLANGYILAGDNGQILRSIDGGAGWGVVTTAPVSTINDIFQSRSGKVFALDDDGTVFQSSDNGDSWSTNLSVDFVPTAMIQLATGRLILGGNFRIMISDDDGANWITISATGIGRMLLLESGRIIASNTSTTANDFMASDDNGITWLYLSTVPNVGAGPASIFQASTGTIFTGAGSGQLHFSLDDGVTWTLYASLGGEINGITEASDGDIFLVDGSDLSILEIDIDDFPLGQEATCDNEVYIANKHVKSNLTHIKIDDGGVFSDIGLPMTLPVALLPATPAANDALYLGTDTGLTLVDTGPFSGLVFDLSENLISPGGAGTITLVWEYWSGAAWSTLTTRDNTGITDPLDQVGVVSVHWEVPTGWATTAVDGVTGYWVRLRVSAISGTWSPPEQQNRDIYAPFVPFVEVAAAQILGDIPALVRIRAQNQSDGNGLTDPDLEDNRVVVGLRSISRGENFQAYINISDEQNPDGITVSVGTDTAFADRTSAPSGRYAYYNSTGAGDTTRVTIAFDSTIARDYYGDFHVFLRTRPVVITTKPYTKLRFFNGSGGITFTTEQEAPTTTGDFTILDFGQISLPISGSFKMNELADTMEINILISATDADPEMGLYDLILIPVDEWAIDSVDKVISNDSELGRIDDVPRFLDIDSLTRPKLDIRTLVRQQSANELIVAEWNPITNGQAMLQANARQRLWFLAMWSSGGATVPWFAKPEVAHTIEVDATYRYLGMRGDR